MGSGSGFEAGVSTRQQWRRRRVIMIASLLPLILVMAFRVWMGGGVLGAVLVAVFTVVLVSGVAVTQRRARVARREVISRGGAFEAPAMLRLEQLLASPRFFASIENLTARLRRRGYGRVGGRLTVDQEGVAWLPGRHSIRRGLAELQVPWMDIDDVELVPMAGVGGGVGLELHLAGGSRLSVHTSDAGTLQVVLDRRLRIQGGGELPTVADGASHAF